MDKLSGFFKRKKLLHLLSVAVLIAGICFGILACSFLGPDKLSSLNQYLTSSLTSVALSSDQTAISKVAIEANLLDLFKITFLGLCIIGIPLILLFLFIKGFSIGFVLAFMMTNNGWAGLGAILISLIIPKLIYLPVLLFVSFYAMSISYHILTGLTVDIFGLIVRYILMMLVLAVGMILAGYIEGFLSIYGMENILHPR